MITPELTSVLTKTEGFELSESNLPATAENGLQVIDNNSDNTFGALLIEMNSLLNSGELDLQSAAERLTEGLSDGKTLPPVSAALAEEIEQNELLVELIQRVVQDQSPNEVFVGAPVTGLEQARSVPTMPLTTEDEIEIASIVKDDKLPKAAKAVLTGTQQAAFNIDEPGLVAEARSKLSDMPNSGTQAILADKNTEYSLSGTSKTPSVELPTQPAQPKLSIGVPVQQARWADNLAGRVSYMLLNNQQSAQISLNPAELGPIEIRLNIQNDQANVNFYAHNATVRDAIEEAFPRLRDMLNENGLNLSQSSVSDQSLSQRQDQSHIAKPETGPYSFMEDTQSTENEGLSKINLTVGLIDHFV